MTGVGVPFSDRGADTFLAAPAPVLLVTGLEDFEISGRSAILRCSTLRWAPQLQNYYGTVCETALEAPVAGPPAVVRVDFWSPSTIRVRFAIGDDVPDSPVPPLPGSHDGRPPVGGEHALSPMVVGAPAVEVPLTTTSDDGVLRVAADGCELTVTRFPFRLELRDAAGEVVWATSPVDIDGLRLARNQWNPPEQRWLFLHRYAYPLGCTAEDADPAAFVSVDLRHDERVVGFGESFGKLDKTGTSQHLWVQEAFGNASPAAYKQTPFYVSSRGHGMFVHTSAPVRIDAGSREHTTTSVLVEGSRSLDLFVLLGSPRAVVQGYLDLTGAPPVPPLWSFGFWLGRITFRSQQEVEDVAAELRRREMPADVIHIDTGWFEKEYVCDLRFSPTRFPDPAGMLSRLAAQGFRVSLWQWPNCNVGSRLFDDGLREGHLARRPSGHVHTFPGGYGEDAALIDFSSPAARDWYEGELGRLFDLGVSAIKVDYGEGAPPDARYAGVPAHLMHNLYPLLYQDSVWRATVAARGEDAVIWARAGWAGSQRYPVHWSGDGIARFADLPCVLRGMLSAAVSGYLFYSHDVGGFSGDPTGELYLRWLGLGIFSSHVRAHGSPPREPWAFGPETEALARDLLQLRYRLLPYLYTSAVRAVAERSPMARPLLLDHPGDPLAWVTDDEYLFGADLLVAPVIEQGATGRSVYLPAGDWVDFHRGTRLTGPVRVDVGADLGTVPLFVRSGAAIPFGPIRQHTGEVPRGPLELHLFDAAVRGRMSIHLGPSRHGFVEWDGRSATLIGIPDQPPEVEVVPH